jgi:uncharacterized phage protein (TIGR01671 family)
VREILFKAKRIDNGEWVEGYYAIAVDKRGLKQHNILVADHNLGYFNWFVIDESTLCQYTGLTDKNGNKIWENDVVKYLADEEFYKCYWDCGNCEYMLVNESGSFGLGYCTGAELEVYGSAFDIGELLGGAEND